MSIEDQCNIETIGNTVKMFETCKFALKISKFRRSHDCISDDNNKTTKNWPQL